MSNGYDAWSAAGTEYVAKREYYGKILVDCVAMVFPGVKGSKSRPVPYDPAVHDAQKLRPFTQISLQLDPLPEMNLNFPIERNLSNFDQDWNKITMPSIRQIGFVTSDGACDLKAFNQSYVKFEIIPGFRKNRDPNKENYTTMKFTARYKDEKDCRKSYLQENSVEADPSLQYNSKPAAESSDKAADSAMVFIKAVIKESKANGKDAAGILDDVKKFIAENSAMCAGITITNPEIIDTINEPPF